MNCLLNLMAVCLFDPSNVYITAGLDAAIDRPSDERLARPCYGTAWCVRPRPSGPIGTIKIGAVVSLSNELTIDYGLSHRSYVNTSIDRGGEFAFVELTWRPFR